MDPISKVKKRLDSFYSNKFFRFFFFAACIGAVMYYYGNAKDKINLVSKDPKIIDNVNIPQKISFIKKTQDTIFVETAVKNEENLKKQQRIEAMATLEKRKEEEKEKAKKRADDLRREFTSKNNSKSTRRIVVGDIVEIKMIITTGDNFNIPTEPMVLSMRITNNKENIYAKYLKGKRAGDIVNIPFSEFMNNQIFQKELERIKKEQNLDNVNINFDAIAKSNIMYRIKILKFK